mmetsp:Transcript_27195/g.86380  ORF Transcript_27195/g.86380 Transcript_27195/m.86380 type:complete len:523 (+) Transcript_27195:2620-4188(+)
MSVSGSLHARSRSSARGTSFHARTCPSRANFCHTSSSWSSWWAGAVAMPNQKSSLKSAAASAAAPETVINAISTMKMVISAVDREPGSIDESDDGEDAALGVGAILGSGMIAFSVIPGLCGIFAGGEQPLELKRRPLARDVLAYGSSLLLLWHITSDGMIDTFESAVMLVGYGTYLLVVVLSAGVREHYRVQWLKKDVRLGESFVISAASSAGTLTPSEAEGRGSSAYQKASYEPPSPPSPASGVSLSTRVQFFDTHAAEGRLLSPDSGFGDDSTLGIDSCSSARVSQEEEAPHRLLAAQRALAGAVSAFVFPLEWLIAASCPECQYDGKQARLYPVTLASAFLWVAALSLVISAIVSRFGALFDLPAAFLGMYIIAIGAEIPDTIQSVTVAKRGYGSMAVSNSCGSQIINILVGLGLPWFLSNWAGIQISIPEHEDLALMAGVQSVVIAVFTALLLCTTIHTWRPGDHRKAILGPGKGTALLLCYAACVAGYPVVHYLFDHDPARAERLGGGAVAALGVKL